MISVLKISVLFSVLTGTAFAQLSNESFPENFSFGAATSAFQIEGAWDEDNKAETIWDHYVHLHPTEIEDQGNADVSCDSYHKYKEDVALAAELGLTHYKFSISWARLLPTGFNNEVSLKGILYYQNLITEIEKYNITPVATIYHWDLPESIQDLGGWVNEDIVDYFTDYAEIVFEHFKSVKNWVTINEPKQVCQGGYGKASKAPFINVSGEADYLCTYHVILAHAAVYRLYQEKFVKLGGKISIGLDGAWNIPASETQTDIDAAERRLLFDFGIFAHPLYFGDWPEVVKDRVGNRSASENFTSSRLPSFTKAQKSSIKGTLDFLALNFYDTKIVADAVEADFASFSFEKDLRVNISVDSTWKVTLDGNSIYPSGLRSFLNWVKETYKSPEIFIAENGIADDGSTLNDYDRIYYIADYLSAVLDSIHHDNVTITGYTMWSLMDNFEWTHGYSMHYGFYSVNFTDTQKTRTPKKSVNYFKQLIENRQIPTPPETTTASPTTSPIPGTSSTDKPGAAYSHSLELVTLFAATISYLVMNTYLML